MVELEMFHVMNWAVHDLHHKVSVNRGGGCRW